ncbi:MAG: NmrA/HSCARG family protein [bacterium]
MADVKIIAVVGATGGQGGGLVRAILADKSSEFTVRAITRDADSENAKALRALGADVVSADIDDLASLEKAFAGAYGAYCVTFYWTHFSPEREIQEASNLAKAAKTAGLQHVIWSTLEDTRKWIPLDDNRMPTLMGKYKVPHFDAKGESDAFFINSGVPTTFLLPSFYWENFIRSGPKKGPDGTLVLTLPIGNAQLAGVAAQDIGAAAYGMFKKGNETIGQRIGVAGEHLTGAEIAAAMTKAFGQPVQFNAISPDVFRSFGFPGADDLGNMFQFYRDFEKVCNDMRDVARTRAFAPNAQTFAQWLESNTARISRE